MRAGKRFGWSAAVLVVLFATRAQAGPILPPQSSWSYWFAGGGAPRTGGLDFGGGAAPTSYATAAITTLATQFGASTPAATLDPITAGIPPARTSAPVADGFINLGYGPYPEAGWIAAGNPQPWYTSPQVASLFGGPPTDQQRSGFASDVLQLVQQSFQQSGVSVNLTTDPAVPAAHTLSVVSGATSRPFPGSIGTSEIGGSGFNFIDQVAKSVQNVDQLEQVVAHNVAHELMLAFGVPEKYDQSGNFIDSTNANFSMMTSPSAVFSPAAAQAINQALQIENGVGESTPLAQYVQPQQVPEPGGWILWALGGLGCVGFSGTRLARTLSERCS